MAKTLDSFVITDGSEEIIDSTSRYLAQSFDSGEGGMVGKVSWYIRRVGNIGGAVCHVCPHGGTYGTSSVPASEPIASSSIPEVAIGTSYSWVTFDFPLYTNDESTWLLPNTKYCVTIGGQTDESNYILLATTDFGAHGGNMSFSTDGQNTWTPYYNIDICFRVERSNIHTPSNIQRFPCAENGLSVSGR